MATATPSRLTLHERRYLSHYIRDAADAVGLRDWTFEVGDVPPEARSRRAEIKLVIGRRYGRLHFVDGFRQLPEREQHEAVAHELVHCHLHHLAEVMRVDVRGIAKPKVFDVLWSSFERSMEHTVDAVTPVFMTAFPAPDWKKKA